MLKERGTYILVKGCKYFSHTFFLIYFGLNPDLARVFSLSL